MTVAICLAKRRAGTIATGSRDADRPAGTVGVLFGVARLTDGGRFRAAAGDADAAATVIVGLAGPGIQSRIRQGVRLDIWPPVRRRVARRRYRICICRGLVDTVRASTAGSSERDDDPRECSQAGDANDLSTAAVHASVTHDTVCGGE
jgi:hypothetical protein